MFRDRSEAGKLLADKLLKYKNNKDVLVLAIPRGGIITGNEIAKELGLDLDVLIVKKIGSPGNPEFAIGAAGSNEYYLNKEISKDVEKEYLEKAIASKQDEVKEKYELFRRGGASLSLKDRTVILTDDGIATGTTMNLAIQILKKQKPKKIILAIPVAPPHSILELSKLVDEVVCLDEPENLMAVGESYENFVQVEDNEVKKILKG